jgi:hypothetical protein
VKQKSTLFSRAEKTKIKTLYTPQKLRNDEILPVRNHNHDAADRVDA